MDDAIDHIECYGAKHSEAIVTESYQNAQDFLRNVDAAQFTSMHRRDLQTVRNLAWVRK